MSIIRWVIVSSLAVMGAVIIGQETPPQQDMIAAIADIRMAYGEDSLLIEGDLYQPETGNDPLAFYEICFVFDVVERDNRLTEDVFICWDEETAQDSLLLDAAGERITLDDRAPLETPAPPATTEEADSDEQASPPPPPATTEEASPDTSETLDAIFDGIRPLLRLDEAIEVVQGIYPNSTLTGFELEDEAGRLVWDFDLDDDLRSVDVDALTGIIVQFGYERDDDDQPDGAVPVPAATEDVVAPPAATEDAIAPPLPAATEDVDDDERDDDDDERDDDNDEDDERDDD